MSASKKTTLSTQQGTMTVETWWDRHSQNYITQLLDADDNQIGDASIDGNADAARCAHAALVAASTLSDAVRFGRYGCVNCLWSCIECKNGSKYRPELRHGELSCAAYSFYD